MGSHAVTNYESTSKARTGVEEMLEEGSRQSSDVDLGRRYSTKANGRLLRRGADDKGLSLEADAGGSPPKSPLGA
ncbi:hypothetical protein HPB47_003329 [Ixodes persulcatus]|uniref:Uncharacterized protein n=1 Tax=Ixodes persulcatus TaxID=34615 RepID=A0AC60PIQ5_IXOPE|nr:hypothetical protein HPB47_003329 [Ixodes persulcatus]